MKHFTIKPSIFFNICLALLVVVLALGACKKDKDDSPEFYIKFKVDKDYQLIFPQDTVNFYSNTTTDISFTNYNWTSPNVEDRFVNFGYDGPVSAGVNKLTYAAVEIGNIYYSIYVNPFKYPFTPKNGTINIESLDTQNKIAKGTFTFEVGSVHVYTSTGYTPQAINTPVINGSFRFKY